MRQMLGLIATLFLLMSCSAKVDKSQAEENENTPKEEMSIYEVENNSFQIELPKGFYVEVDSSGHWEYYLYRVHDSTGKQVLSFYDGWFTQHSQDKKYGPSDFEENVRLDTIVEKNGQMVTVRHVVLFAEWYADENSPKAYPLFVEFTYYPQIVDSSVCEKIVQSAKIHSANKGYLCSVYVAEGIPHSGETMKTLRERSTYNMVALRKFDELESAKGNIPFEEKGTFVVLADCFMENVYKGSFYMDGSCKVKYNGNWTERKDFTRLVDALENKALKESLKNICNF